MSYILVSGATDALKLPLFTYCFQRLASLSNCAANATLSIARVDFVITRIPELFVSPCKFIVTLSHT